MSTPKKLSKTRPSGTSAPPIIRNSDPIIHKKTVVKQRIIEMKQDLPHLYGWKWYTWAKVFYESRNKINLLTAGNQASKSTSMIRKNIEWACNKKLWKELWPDRQGNPNTPRQFWYFYPTNETATTEFEKKWLPELMPRGEMKNHELYGWEVEYAGGFVSAIHFRSGVTIYFKAYSQRLINLQASTVHMISGDEEMPEEFVDELLARLSATGGYFNLAFTATQGLQLWFRAMECIGTPEEAFPQANKQCVSLYDCQVYEDGSPGHWSIERIKEREASCTSQAEILRRVHGRFVRDEGRKFANFSPDRNLSEITPVPADWRWYGGVDIGSGGKGRSAGAVIFIVVDPEATKGRVVRSWRGDHQETTAADILNKFKELRGRDPITQACYDYQSREFALIAARSGEPFIPADKARDAGAKIVNLLFQANALMIDNGAGDNAKLVTELMSVPVGAKNNKFQDDLSDTLRYVVAMIPWNFAKIAPASDVDGVSSAYVDPDIPQPGWTEKQYQALEIRQRRGEKEKPQDAEWQEFYDDIAEWNEAYGS